MQVTGNKGTSQLTLEDIIMIVQNPLNQSSSQTENTCSNITMIDVVNVKEGEGEDILDPKRLQDKQ